MVSVAVPLALLVRVNAAWNCFVGEMTLVSKAVK
jgi:hypothetical protein